MVSARSKKETSEQEAGRRRIERDRNLVKGGVPLEIKKGNKATGMTRSRPGQWAMGHGKCEGKAGGGRRQHLREGTTSWPWPPGNFPTPPAHSATALCR